MSQKSLTKIINFSQSPSMTGFKKISRLSFSGSPLNETDLQTGNVKICQSMNQLPKNLSKLIKITKKNFDKNNNSLGPHIRESSKHQGYLSTSTKQVGLESSLKKKLDREQNLEKKLEIFMEFSERLAEKSKTFQVFFGAFSDLFEVIQGELKLSEKLRENEARLNEVCENLQNEIDKLKDENLNFMIELDKLKKEEKKLKSTCREQSILLNSLKNAGFPVEELYENSKKSIVVEPGKIRGKSEEKDKINFKELPKGKVKKKARVSEKTVPKLQLRKQDDDVSYHEEFMAKFDEFSESWRELILREKENKSN